MANIVWVLGAGFSAPLGGPMLGNLFSANAHRDIAARYHSSEGPMGLLRQNVLGGPMMAARRVFLAGVREDRGYVIHSDTIRQELRGMWDDAEGFLDLLDVAAADPKGALARRLISVASALSVDESSVVALHKGALRMLAVECSTFLIDGAPASERWEPYREWVKLISSDSENLHTVVTFNYDLALEMLGLQDAVLLPANADRPGACILKLHGSVNWRRANGALEVVPNDPHFAAGCAENECAIAPPGPSKATVVRDDFEPLWKLAETRIQNATSVFFIGYRFPPTDSTARRRILSAVPSSGCGLNIVLGPSDPNGDIARLVGLLGFRAPNAAATVHRMWAQDFLSVVPTGLFG